MLNAMCANIRNLSLFRKTALLIIKILPFQCSRKPLLTCLVFYPLLASLNMLAMMMKSHDATS